MYEHTQAKQLQVIQQNIFQCYASHKDTPSIQFSSIHEFYLGALFFFSVSCHFCGLIHIISLQEAK